MNEGHIFINGDITESLYESIKPQIQAASLKDRAVVHINSRGGDVEIGFDIYHELQSLGKPVDVIIKGKCMSIATLISMAAKSTGGKIKAYNPSEYMVHNSWVEMAGNAQELERGASQLKKIDDQMAAIYKTATGLNDDKIREMLARETFLTPDEAKSLGFVDEVVDSMKVAAFGKTEIKMEQNEKKSIFNSFKQKLDELDAMLFGPKPKAIEMPLQDGRMIQIDSEDGNYVGKTAMIDGQPCPPGNYVLQDGSTLIVDEGGMVSAVTPAAAQQPPAQQKTPEQLQLEALQQEVAALKASMAQTEQAKQAAEQAKAQAEEKNTTVAQMYNTIKAEYEELRKKTIGDEKPPAGPQSHEKKPKGANESDYWAQETQAFLKEHVPHLIKTQN